MVAGDGAEFSTDWAEPGKTGPRKRTESELRMAKGTHVTGRSGLGTGPKWDGKHNPLWNVRIRARESKILVPP